MAQGRENVGEEASGNLHKRVVDGDHEDLTGVLQRRMVDVARHVGAGARRACGSGGLLVSYRHSRYMEAYHGCGNIWKRTEGSRDTDDNALALELLGDVDLVARRGLEELNLWNGQPERWRVRSTGSRGLRRRHEERVTRNGGWQT
jgi:hypothetical protein